MRKKVDVEDLFDVGPFTRSKLEDNEGTNPLKTVSIQPFEDAHKTDSTNIRKSTTIGSVATLSTSVGGVQTTPSVEYTLADQKNTSTAAEVNWDALRTYMSGDEILSFTERECARVSVIAENEGRKNLIYSPPKAPRLRPKVPSITSIDKLEMLPPLEAATEADQRAFSDPQIRLSIVAPRSTTDDNTIYRKLQTISRVDPR